MTKLNTSPNISDGDGYYAELLAAHEGLSEQETNRLNAQLVLILSNHVGTRSILSEAIRLAKKSLNNN